MCAEEVDALVEEDGGERRHSVQEELGLPLLHVLLGDEPVVDDLLDGLLQRRLVLPQLLLRQQRAVDWLQVAIPFHHQVRRRRLPRQLVAQVVEAPLLGALVEQTLPFRNLGPLLLGRLLEWLVSLVLLTNTSITCLYFSCSRLRSSSVAGTMVSRSWYL